MKPARRVAAVCPEDIHSPSEGELTDTININFTAIPSFVREELAAATLDCVKSFLRQPGGREKLDARIASKKQRLQ